MAEFLRLAGDAGEMRETAIQANHKYFLFNEAQCRRLWENLSAASWAFAPSFSYSLPVQQKFLLLHKEFYSIVLRADEIMGKCSDKQSWLKEALFLGGNRQVFQELSADLQSCMRNFHYLTKSLCLDPLIPAPSRVIDVAIPEARLDEDLHKDVTSLMRKLEERQVNFGEQEKHLASSRLDEDLHKDVTSLMIRLEEGRVDFGEQEKHLASYIEERVIFHCAPEPEQDILGPAKPRKLPFYEVHREDPVHVENLAVGGYGIVSKVKWLGLICAKKEFLNVKSTVDFVKEVSALAALNHSRTVKLLCSNGEMPKPYFIMEFIPMTLEKFCERKDAADSMRFEILPSINMMLQISSGIEYLHENGVVHRDLKSANILVRESHHRGLRNEEYVDVKLTDFGLAKMKISDESMVPTGRMGTTQWSAPEVLSILSNSPKSRIDWRKADTYSFAVVCSEILTGQSPYSGIWAWTRSVASVISGELRPKLPQDCPIYLSEFLRQCWAQNPKDRPTFKEITQTLSRFKTCLLIGTVPERTHVRKVPLLKGLGILGRFLANEASVRPQVWCPDPESILNPKFVDKNIMLSTKISEHVEENIKLQKKLVLDISRNIEKVMDFSIYLQQCRVPRLLYFTDVFNVSRLITRVVPGLKSVQLHLMCEHIEGIHIVDEQKGCRIPLPSEKYLRVGLVRDLTSIQIEAFVGPLSNESIADLFDLHRISYTSGSKRLAWVCGSHKREGEREKTMEIVPA